MIPTLTLITRPTEPLTLADAVAHLRVSDTAEDALITRLIPAARKSAEQYIRRGIGSQTWRYDLDAWAETIQLPMAPASEVESITYTAKTGTVNTLNPSDYLLHGPSGLLYLPAGTTWPAVDLVPVLPIQITYSLGLDPVPEDILAALLLTIGHLYQHRESITAVKVDELPHGVKHLLDPYRDLGA
jgi:uncharacterized phiE125 gp8 family phage protein